MNTIRLIALVLAALGAVLLGQGYHTALADGEYGTLYIDVQPDANNTTEGFGNIEVCTHREDIGDGYGDDDGLLEVGERFSIDVVIQGANDLAGPYYIFYYDNTKLKVTAYNWTSWKLGPGGADFGETAMPDTDGAWSVGYVQGTGVNGDGVLTRITLEAIADGTADVWLCTVPDDCPSACDSDTVDHFYPEVLVDDSPGDVRVVVGGLCPSPVGGIAELPEVSGSSGHNHMALAGLAAAALVALTGGAWYARRRWLR